MVKNVFAPSTGGTVTLTQSRHQYCLLNPAGAILACTVALPSSPNDGDIVRIGSNKTVTTLTMTSGGTIQLSLSTIALGGFGAWIYDSGTTTWYRVG